MKKKRRNIIIAVLALAIITGVTVPVAKSQGILAKGNAEKYSVAETEALPDSPLKGRTYIFLGSSVTYGSAAKGESFADFLVKRDGITAIKEAVSGTTLVDGSDKSYVARLKDIDKEIKADAFICQLSTNDATKNKPLGKVSSSYELDAFDTKTVAGAIEYIVAYTYKTWDCPVVFYTGTKYNSSRYPEMIELLYKLQEKWHFTILDMWNDDEMNAVSKSDYKLYMANGIHPTRAGYREWWLPKFEETLEALIK